MLKFCFCRLGKIVDHGKLVEGLKKYFPQKPEDLTEDETDVDSEMTQVFFTNNSI